MKKIRGGFIDLKKKCSFFVGRLIFFWGEIRKIEEKLAFQFIFLVCVCVSNLNRQQITKLYEYIDISDLHVNRVLLYCPKQ